MTVARSYNVAVEAVHAPAPKARSAQLAVEVVSSTGASAAPLTGNPAVLQTLLAEAIYVPGGTRARSAQLAVEVISRSGLGANPLPDNGAKVDTFTAEVVHAPQPRAQASELAAEVISRSGLGRDPLTGNPAVLSSFVLEIVSYGDTSAPPDCDCVITPALPPAKYLMRRRRRLT